ncbi:proline-rich receptor-like protein kinase PERK9 [Miscanthus floridulus]|uniref:proline-rich receptor-like protein kinase PERK9 n=1 Tax=Miscanthus floridulus TaxID=154761 RepID=UPI0034575132
MSIQPSTAAVPPSSTPAPSASGVLPQAAASTSALVPTSSQPLAQGAPRVPRAVFTLEQTTDAIVDLSHGLAELRLTMNTMLQLFNTSPPQFGAPQLQYGAPPLQPLLPPPPPSVALQHAQPASYSYGMPSDVGLSTASSPALSSVPIHQLRFPPSPSPIPPWALNSSGPVYTSVPPRSHVPDHGASRVSGTLYGGTDGLLLPGSSMAPSPPSYHAPGYGEGTPKSAQGNGPPKFHKIEFTMYDGSVDPLNWLTHCEQFFRGQLTPASQRT